MDGRGSVIGEVTKSGFLSPATVTTKAYTPFGEQIGEATSGLGWNGEYYNAVTGQVYLRARFYEPEMNRFSQKDIVRGSVTSPQSLNRYAYCVNDPLNFVDPSGKVITAAIGAVTGAAAAAKSVSAAATKASQASKPIQSTTKNVNPNNVVQATNQAKQDARRAADIANAVAPGSPAAQQATRAYAQTVQYSQAANATHNPALAQQAVNSSRTAVNYANSAVTGKSSANNAGTNAAYSKSPAANNPSVTGGYNPASCKMESTPQNANMSNILKFFGVDSPEKLPELPENAMVVLENTTSVGIFVEGKAIVMDSDKYCEYVFFGLNIGTTGLGLNGGKLLNGADAVVTGEYVYNVNSPSDYEGVFISSSGVFGNISYGGAISPGTDVYSTIKGGESRLAGSITLISGTYYFALSDDWIYEEAPISWYESEVKKAHGYGPAIMEQDEESIYVF